MPLFWLEEHLKRNGLVQEDSLESLRGCRIGIDAATWLRRLRFDEPWQPAMGGLPLTMKTILESHFQEMENAGITPVFVFHGINMARMDPSILLSRSQLSVSKRRMAWRSLLQGSDELKRSASLIFRQFVVQSYSADFIGALFEYFKQANIEFFRAPYSAQAQLVWLLNNHFVHAIWGLPDLLLFEANRVVLNLNFGHGTLTWVPLQAVCEKYGISPEQFLDACLLTGYEQALPPFPFLERKNPIDSIEQVITLIAENQTAMRAMVTAAQNAEWADDVTKKQLAVEKHRRAFMQIKTMIRHHLVLVDTKCSILPLNPTTCPRDLHQVVGSRLPPKLFFFISQGVISTQVINDLVSGLIFEAAPLMPVKEYRDVIDHLIRLRTVALAIAARSLPEHLSRKEMSALCWFHAEEEPGKDGAPDTREEKGKNESIVVNGKAQIQIGSLHIPLLLWNVRQGKISSFFSRESPANDGNRVGLSLAAKVAHETSWYNFDDSDAYEYKTSDEVELCVLLNALVLMRYVVVDKTVSEDRLTSYGRVLSKFNKHDEQALVLLELIRLKWLHGDHFHEEKDPTRILGSEKEEPEILLISRVLSLLPATLKREKWTADIDADLLAFYSLSKALHRSLRNLIEMVMLQIFVNRRPGVVSGQEGINTREYSTISSNLPFLVDHSTAMGLVVKAFLKEEAYETRSFASKFPQCVDCENDLQNAFAFWDQFAAGVDESVAPKHICSLLKRANHFLQGRRTAASL